MAQMWTARHRTVLFPYEGASSIPSTGGPTIFVAWSLDLLAANASTQLFWAHFGERRCTLIVVSGCDGDTGP